MGGTRKLENSWLVDFSTKAISVVTVLIILQAVGFGRIHEKNRGFGFGFSFLIMIIHTSPYNSIY